MTRTRVKICGITNGNDALLAAELGADAIGFIFAEDSKRRVSPSVVRAVVSELPPFVSRVGVFVNSSLEELQRIMVESGLDVVQLHGDESPTYIKKVPYPVIRTFRPRPGFALSALNEYNVHAFLFDTYAEGQQGGTGKTFDWNLVRGADTYGRIILSGGISPGNAAEAIQALRPFALDVNSSVEIAPGKKDRQRLEELFDAIREADAKKGPLC